MGSIVILNENTYQQLINNFDQSKKNIKSFSLLETKVNNKIFYAINEIKVVDIAKTLKTDVFINDIFLETFRGSGLVFSTKTGSTGYMRSVHGAILIAKENLWELQEIAPVATKEFYSINAPLILSANQYVYLKSGIKNKKIIIDTFEQIINQDDLMLKISRKKIKVIYDPNNDKNLITRIRKVFVHNNNNKNKIC